MNLITDKTGSLLNTLESLIKDCTSQSSSLTFITNNMAALSNEEEFDKKYEQKREKIKC
jgi:hypothetical protein